MSQQGVIYYNIGTSCAVRLLVSLTSLRRHYDGPVTILSEGTDSHLICDGIGKALGADVREWDCGIPQGRNRVYLAKTRYSDGSPYETTIALDADTLVVGPVDELFEMADQSSFCVAKLGNWKSNGRRIAGRIQKWSRWLPEDIEPALKFGPAINVGVMAFRRDAPIFREWMDRALPGREHFIPDEVSCQIILHRHPHRILDGIWNCSCKHDDPGRPGVRIIHYHGKKHCRPGLPFHGATWLEAFQEVLRRNIAGVQDWMPAGDKMLRRALKAQKKACAVQPPAAAENPVQSAVHAKVAESQTVKLVIGAGRTDYEGWISTDRETLDVTIKNDWEMIMGPHVADRFLAEHVWEHLPQTSMERANALVFRYLKEGGCFRIAVPDGFHPDPDYVEQVKPGGTGKSANDHKVLFDHRTLTAVLEAAGFTVEKLEYWDEEGEFHFKRWHSEDGHVKRSAFHDRRNREGDPAYTSLIIDAWKPNRRPVHETNLWCRRGHFNRDQAEKISDLCRTGQPKYVLEIGFCTGRSAAAILHSTANCLRRMIAVDRSFDYKAPEGRDMVALLKSRFSKFDVIEQPSREVLTPEFFATEFPEGIDWATIDGDHTYEGCSFDLEAIAPFVNKHGVMIIDDYRSGPPNGVSMESVTKSVDDFNARHTGEFREEIWNKSGKGLCILKKL